MAPMPLLYSVTWPKVVTAVVSDHARLAMGMPERTELLLALTGDLAPWLCDFCAWWTADQKDM